MAKQAKRRSTAPSQHRYPREARLNQSLRQVIAEELVAIDDENLDLVTITSIDVDPEMNRAIVFFDSLRGEEGDEEILDALTRHRVRLQSSVARQIRSKKTPILEFKPDEVIRSAERIEKILASNPSPLRETPDETADQTAGQTAGQTADRAGGLDELRNSTVDGAS